MNHLYSFRHIPIALLLLCFPTMLLQADEVELNPGTIKGNLQLGAETITSARLTALSGLFTAEQNIAPNSVVGSYDLTVQVEADSSRDYQVTADIRTDNNRDRLIIRNRSVTVVDGEEATLDFIVNPVAYIDGTITVEGEAIQWVQLVANQTAAPFDWANTFHTGVDGPESLDVSFAVTPGQEVRCSGTVTLTNGVQIPLPAQVIVPDAQTPVRCDYLIEAGPEPGTLQGIIDFSGLGTVDRYQLWINGPINLQTYFNRPFNTPEGGEGNSHNYSVELTPGTYSLSTITRAFLNNNDDELRFPEGAYSPARTNVELVSNEPTEVFIEACQAYINGSLEFTGSASMEDLIFGTVQAFGDNAIDSPTRFGSAFDRMTPGSGDFDLVVTDGNWGVRTFANVNLRRAIDDPDGFLSERIYLHIDPAPLDLINLSCGETVERNYSVPTGRVTFNFSVAEGGVLTNPELRFGSCQKRDDSDQLVYSYSFDSFSQGQIDVEQGTVTFEGPAGDCDNIRARATVNGTLTTFAEIDGLEILPGVDVVIDIGGPSLEVTFPEPQQRVNADEVTVEGLVTDDVDVVSVEINGLDAVLATTNNPDDPVELSFEATIPLVKGANEIEIIATDGSGKTGQTTFTIFNDAGAPEVSFVPDDDVSVSDAEQAVKGSATDDSGIDSVVISLNGSEIVMLDGEGALTVEFDEAITLESGENTITVEATDISGQVTTTVHKVTLADNSAPTVSAGGPYSLNEGSSITLEANGSDPDLDSLNYAWDLDGDGEFDDGASAEVTFDAAAIDGPMSKPVAVQVTDTGGLTATDNTVVEVNNVAPSATGSVVIPSEPVPVGGVFDVSVPFTDPGSADTHTVVWHWGDGSSDTGSISDGRASASHQYSEQGFYRISCVITDDDGASSENCQAANDMVIIDRNDGFVTGGGWIESQPGAYLPEPLITGKANFGFVTKYSNPDLEPKGNVEFQFKLGDINFHASSFRWLVVTESHSTAYVRGVGTINQSGEYAFLLTVIDGKQAGGKDRLRLQIWSEQAVLMYDNLSSEINGGSIVIHKLSNAQPISAAKKSMAPAPALESSSDGDGEISGGSTGIFLLLFGFVRLMIRRTT